MKINPNLRAEMIGATSRDLRVFKDKTEVAKLAAQSAEVISLPKGQTDPFARHAQSLLTPVSGFIDGYKDRAKTSVSSREVIQTLAELEADKAGLDLQNTLELIQRTPSSFSVLMGRDTLLLAALMFGAKGAIPATCNIAPEFCVGIYEAHRRGDEAAAREFQSRLSPVRMALTLATGNGAVKEAMTLLGRPAGPNRRPISP